MKLSSPSPQYDQRDQAEFRRALERADAQNHKTGQDAYFGPGGWPYFSTATGITALSGGGQANATQLTAMSSRVDTALAAGDSVTLPPANAGRVCFVTNNTAVSIQVYGKGADTINTAAAATGVSVAAGKTLIVTCPKAGFYYGGSLA